MLLQFGIRCAVAWGYTYLLLQFILSFIILFILFYAWVRLVLSTFLTIFYARIGWVNRINHTFVINVPQFLIDIVLFIGRQLILELYVGSILHSVLLRLSFICILLIIDTLVTVNQVSQGLVVAVCRAVLHVSSNWVVIGYVSQVVNKLALNNSVAPMEIIADYFTDIDSILLDIGLRDSVRFPWILLLYLFLLIDINLNTLLRWLRI